MTRRLPAFATPLYDAAALRAIEARAAADAAGDGFALMARAGQAAWREVLHHWPDARRIVVLCGPGNNGGDGYVLARHAHEAGRTARVLRLPAHLPRGELAERACREYAEAGGEVSTFDGILGDVDLIVDAIFGIGLSRAPDAGVAALFDSVAASGVPVLSLDTPSGIDGDRGSAPGRAIVASRTLQFIAAHAGLSTGAALEHTGVLSLAPLDVPQAWFDGLDAQAWWIDADALPALFAPRPCNAHKGSFGHVLCVGGDLGKGGAVLLAAEAALRSGAGLTSIATRDSHVPAALARRPEVMAHGVADAAQLAPLLDAASVVAVGPGLGQHPWGEMLFDAALSAGKPLVLDADALNLLARRMRSLPPDTILTPHPGEAARLLGISTPEVQANRFAAVRLLCESLGCVVVLKGAGTLVAAPEQTVRVIGAGNPGMAVGGMGDVLTGVIAALRAQGFDAFAAACTGALLHAVAGDDAARDGQRGLLPADLFAFLRKRCNGTMQG